MDTSSESGGMPYPRPDFDRSARWSPLDGIWDFVPDHLLVHSPQAVSATKNTETIMVPGAWETASSGGRHDWLERGWYRRQITVPAEWMTSQIILKFGAVFYETSVWLDQEYVGCHKGGYLPFEVDLTEALADRTHGTLLIRVDCPRDKRDVPHGKQRSIPVDDYNGCSFTPTSGIWQSVWIEPRPATHLAQINLVPAAHLDAIQATAVLSGPNAAGMPVRFEIVDHDIEATVIADGIGRAEAILEIPEPRLWTPTDPYCYRIKIRTEGSETADEVAAYTGLRNFEVRNGTFWLNGERIYLRGVLDQGYWYEHGLAAGSDDALIKDLRVAADSGFNLVRKHLKAENPRWLYHADRMGMLVWAEPASTGRYSPEGAARFERELAGLIERDRNHPSIIIWGAYNEEWGLDWDIERTPEHSAAAVRAYELARSIDPTRPVVENSGWTHVATDIVDWHYYSEDPSEFRAAIDRTLISQTPFAVWHSAKFPVPKRLTSASAEIGDAAIMNSEYGGGWNSLDRAWHTRWQTQFLRLRPENQGYVYTELVDIEHETVGIYDAMRRPKDQDGYKQRWAHADTVICPLVAPIAYSTDVIACDGRVQIPVIISHHGASAVDGQLRWWVEQPQDIEGQTPVHIAPFVLSEPVSVDVRLNVGFGSVRLQLAVTVNDRDIARTFIDIREQLPENHLPTDTGWRPTEETLS